MEKKNGDQPTTVEELQKRIKILESALTLGGETRYPIVSFHTDPMDLLNQFEYRIAFIRDLFVDWDLDNPMFGKDSILGLFYVLWDLGDQLSFILDNVQNIEWRPEIKTLMKRETPGAGKAAVSPEKAA